MLADPQLTIVFLVYVVAIVTMAVIILARFLSVKAALAGTGLLALWLGYAGALGYAGVVGDQRLPVPGIFILLVPIVAFVASVFGRSRTGGQIAIQIPLGILIGLQAFRIGVEVTLHRLWALGMVPRLMTLGGGNIEILVGLSAPLFAWIAASGAAGRRAALIWNVVGLASLLNVAARAVLSAPGPLNFVHGDVANTALGIFPFSFIPGFMAPLAMILHVLTFRALRVKANAGSRPADALQAALS